jgi:hypothetical protein
MFILFGSNSQSKKLNRHYESLTKFNFSQRINTAAFDKTCFHQKKVYILQFRCTPPSLQSLHLLCFDRKTK